MSALFPHLTFDPQETPVSYAARLAALHTGASIVPFLRDIGVKHNDLLACKDGALDRLSTVAGVDVAKLRNNSVRGNGNRWFDVRGHRLSAEFFANPYTVFCPACLREDDEFAGDPAVVRKGKFIWTLRPVRTCPEHGLALVRRKRVNWDDAFHQLALRVPERDRALDDLAGSLAQRSPSSLQVYVTSRLDGAVGPSWLDSQTLEQAVRATEMLGALLEFGPNANLDDFGECDWDTAGRAGFEVTCGGEDGIRAALCDIQEDFQRRGGKPNRGNVLGPLYDWLASNKQVKEPGDIRRIVREHIFAEIAVGAGVTVLGEKLGERRLHSVETLASEKGLNARTLRNILASHGLVPPVSSGVGYCVFDAAMGRKIAESVQKSTKLESLPKVLNCTRPQAGQLVDEGLLDPIVDGRLEAVGRTRKSIGNQDIERFLSALRDSAQPTDRRSGHMVTISKAAEKAKLSCIEIVHLVLGGFLPTVVRLNGVEGYAAILVDPDEVRSAKAQHLPGMSATDAFGRLKIPRSSGWELVHREKGPRLRPIVVTGVTGQHRIFRFDEEHVAAFRAEFTTEIRIANAYDMEKKDVVARLKKRGVRPILRTVDIGIELYRTKDIPNLKAA